MAVDKAPSSGCTPQTEVRCALGPAEFRNRLARIRDLTHRALRERQREGLQLTLAYDAGAAAEVRELVALERACCAFLDFQLDERADRLVLTITAPPSAQGAIEEIFSEFAG